MTNKNFWQEFYKTGKVDDYLNYRKSFFDGRITENGCEKDSWTRSKQKELL